MNKLNNKLELLSSCPVAQALLALGLPIMLGMLINALYNLADAYFVSGLGQSQLGAISVLFPLSQLLVAIGLMFGSGAASYLPRLLGAKDQQTTEQAASIALYSSLTLGAGIILFCLLFLQPILNLLGATQTIMPYALNYGYIYLVASFFNIFNVTMNNIAASEGAAKTTMCALLLGAALNIVLDPIFIYQLKLGVTGAAIATAISQLASSLIYLLYILQKQSVFSFSLRYFTLKRELFSSILAIGLPTMLFQLLTSLAIALTNRAAFPFGDSAIAAIGAVTRITTMETLVVFGFLKGFQPLAGFSYGAGNFSRLHLTIQTARRWANVFCLLVGLLTALLAGPIISQFANGSADIINIGTKALQASGLSFSVFGFYTVYSSLLLALGKAKAGLLLGACRQGLCFLPLIWLLPTVWQLNGVIYAQPLADLLAAAVAGFVACNLRKKITASEKNTTFN